MKRYATKSTPEQIRHHQIQRRLAIQEQEPAEALPVAGADCDHWTDIPPTRRPLHWEPEHDEAAQLLEHGRRIIALLDGEKAA